MEFEYTVTTQKTFDTAVSRAEQEIVGAGFRLLHVHDVQKTLSEKEFNIESMKIIEFCNAKSAYAAIQADVKIGLCLPCKILVYVKDGQCFISGMRPIILPVLFPSVELGSLPWEIDVKIKGIIDNSK